jgi:hypothetical protein
VTGALRYLYAVVGAESERPIVEARLIGIEGGGVEPVREGRLAGVTSAVPASGYEEEPLNAKLQDLDWLAPRAAAHQEVNRRLLEIVPAVVPLAFGAIYRDVEGVRELLRKRGDDFAARLDGLTGRAEWIVAIERHGAPAVAGEATRALDDEIAKAAPGRAFLLGKKRDEVEREDRRSRDAAIADRTWTALEAVADRLYREPLIEDPATIAVARFSALVARDRERALNDTVRSLKREAVAGGYRIRLSGPWPAYRFGGLPSERVPTA